MARLNNQMNKPQVNMIQNHRIDPPVLPNIFGPSQSADEFDIFHKKCKREYEEKVQKADKPEKNPKNFFLLLRLKNFNHKIGTKIGLKDYGFISNTGLNDFKSRDSSSFHGADYKKEETSWVND